MHVTFVVPPVLTVVRPGIGVSTLVPILQAAGITCDIAYENHAFASQIGLELNEWIAMKTPPQFLLGDWLFSTEPVSEELSEEIYLSKFWSYRGEQMLDELRHARRLAQAFIWESAERLLKAGPDVIGFSSLFQQNAASLSIAKAIKQLSPSTLVCMGGANCEGPMGMALSENYPQIDYVFGGEAEHSFLEFLQQREASSRHNSLPILQTKFVVGTQPVEMESLPAPVYDHYFESLRQHGIDQAVIPGLLVETSRGCWWGAKHHCKFCGLNGATMSFRSKSADKVYAEIDEITRRYGVTRLEMTDNIVPTSYFTTLFPRLGQEDRKLEMFFEVKANMTFEQLEVLAKAGVTWVQPGIESLSDHTLKLMDKGVSALQNIAFLRSSAELGMRALWSILYGFPGELEEDYYGMELLIPYIEHLHPPMGFARLRLDRFSPYFTRAEEYGYADVRPYAAYAYVYDKPLEVLSRIAYSFDAAKNPACLSSNESLEAAVERWRESNYNSPNKPMLLLMEMGSHRFVVDSRRVARKRMTALEPIQVEFLTRVRTPQSLARAVKETGIPQASLDALLEAGFILQIGERVLSIVCESNRRIISPESGAQFPGGSLKEMQTTSAH